MRQQTNDDISKPLGEELYIKSNEDSKYARGVRLFTLKSIIYILLIVLIAAGLLALEKSYREKQISFIRWSEQETQRLKKEVLAKDRTIAAVKAQPKRNNNLLVLYAYYETPDSRINIVHFILHGLHSQADFIFIINGDSNIDQLLPQNAPNIKVIRRNNSCFDLGSEAEVLRSNDYELTKNYKYFILMNGSVRGPFLPTYVEACWSDIFINKINDEVKLVGTTYNYWGYHVQSMVLATDRIGIEILLAGNETDSSSETDPRYMEYYLGNPESLVGLSGCPASKFHAVSAEISLTHLIRRRGYKVTVLMTSAISDAMPKTDSDNNGAHLEANSYNLASVHPYEIVFIKARAGWENSMDNKLLNKITEWHDKLNYSSWQVCQKYHTH
jgi:hypothetical protein